MSAMTKVEFKTRWESNDEGGGIMLGDIADCAIAWGVNPRPRTAPVAQIIYEVTKAAGVENAEDLNPNK